MSNDKKEGKNKKIGTGTDTYFLVKKKIEENRDRHLFSCECGRGQLLQ